MLGLGETLARRRGLLRAMKSLRGLEDYYRRIVFSVADQTTPRDNRVDVLTKPTITTPTRLRTALFTRLSRETFVRSCNRLLGGWVEKKIVDTIASSLCHAPAALPSCKGGDGQRGRCKAGCCLGSDRAANILSGSGCVPLLFVWAVSARQRLALDCFGRFVPCTPQAPRM